MTYEEALAKYPCPDREPKLMRYWKMYIESVSGRENFKPHHLNQLKILCQMLVECDLLSNIIEVEGYTYTVDGKNGEQIKPRPEISVLQRNRAEIRNYSKVLGLLLFADTSTNLKEKEDEWN